MYEADIGNIFDHFGNLFYQYHVQFTRKAAAYLEKGIKIDWSKRNTELFQLIVSGAKAKLCDHCSQSDHQSQFCPSQINVYQMKDLNRLRGLANMMQLRINMVVPKTHIKGKKSVTISKQNFVTSKVVPSCMCVRN